MSGSWFVPGSVSALCTLCGATFVTRSDQTQQDRAGGKKNLGHSTLSIKYGKF